MISKCNLNVLQCTEVTLSKDEQHRRRQRDIAVTMSIHIRESRGSVEPIRSQRCRKAMIHELYESIIVCETSKKENRVEMGKNGEPYTTSTGFGNNESVRESNP